MTEKTMLLFAAIATAAFLFATQSHANIPACGSRDAMIALLNDRFKETRQTYAIDTQNRRIEIFANIKNGSWSLLLTDPSGRACVVAAGRGFENGAQT